MDFSTIELQSNSQGCQSAVALEVLCQRLWNTEHIGSYAEAIKGKLITDITQELCSRDKVLRDVNAIISGIFNNSELTDLFRMLEYPVTISADPDYVPFQDYFCKFIIDPDNDIDDTIFRFMTLVDAIVNNKLKLQTRLIINIWVKVKLGVMKYFRVFISRVTACMLPEYDNVMFCVNGWATYLYNDQFTCDIRYTPIQLKHLPTILKPV